MDGRSRQAVAARSRWSQTCVAAQVGRHVVVDGDRRCNNRVGRRLLERSRWCPSGGWSRQGHGRCGHDRGSRAVTGPGRGRVERRGIARGCVASGSGAVGRRAGVAGAVESRGQEVASGRGARSRQGRAARNRAGSRALRNRAGVHRERQRRGGESRGGRGRGRRRCEGCGRRSRRQGCQVGGRSNVSGGARSSAGVRVAEKSL